RNVTGVQTCALPICEMPSPDDPPPAAPPSAALIRTTSTFNRRPQTGHWLGYFPIFLADLTLAMGKNHPPVNMPVDNCWPVRRRVRLSTAPLSWASSSTELRPRLPP